MYMETLRISSTEFKKIILKKFEGKIFHITNEKNYKKILESNAILATNFIKNQNVIWGSELNQSYFRSKNCVSVCDLFHNNDNKLIFEAMDKYSFYSPNAVVKEGIAYYLILNKNIYEQCISWKLLDKKEVCGYQIVPNLESGISDRILLSDITHAIKVITNEKSIIEIEKDYTDLLKE